MRFALPSLLALCALVLCALVLFTGLDGVGWTDAREARDARVAGELILHREPLTPLYAGDAWFEKPVLAYAPEIVARLWPGSRAPASPLRSRQIRVVAALALLLVTGALAARRFGARAGAWSAIVLLSTLGLPFATRADGTQLFATLLGWSACAAFAPCLWSASRGTMVRLLGGYLALAAALLVAGPWAALWPLAGVALYAALARDRAALARVRPLPGLLIMIGAALPWYGAMVDRHGAGFLVRSLGFPYGAEPPRTWAMQPLLALTFLVIAFYPWSALLPEALRHASAFWRRGPADRRTIARAAGGEGGSPALAHEWREQQASLWILSTLAVALLPVAFHAGVPMTAVLPALPAAAMLCGRFAHDAFEDAARLRRPIAHAARMLALVGTLGALLLAVASRRVPEAGSDVRLLAAVTFVTAWLPLLFTWRDRPAIAVALLALPCALGAPIATGFVLPALEGYVSARVVAETVNDHSPPFAPLAVFEPPPPSLRTYAMRNIVITTPSAERLREFRASDGLAYIAFPPRAEGDIARRLAVPLEIVMRSPSLVLARVNPDSPASNASTR